MAAIGYHNVEGVRTLLEASDPAARARGLDLERGINVNGATALNVVRLRLTVQSGVLASHSTSCMLLNH